MRRAQSPIYVVLWFIAIMFALYLATLVFGRFLEPIAEIAKGMSAVKDAGYGGHIDLILTSTMWSFILLGVGAIVLFVVFAVWKEGYLGQSRRRRP